MANTTGKKFGGRQKGSLNKATLDTIAARELVRQMITQNLEPLLVAQIANAMGVKYLVSRNKKTGKFTRVGEAMAKALADDPEETIEVWEKDPSVQAFTDLLNRAIDKPKEQPQDVKVDGVLTVQWATPTSQKD